MAAPGPYELRPAFVNEDIEILITVGGDADLSAWSLQFRLWGPGGDVVSGTAISLTDADAREVTASAVGLTLEAGVYRWSARRTDTAARTLIAWGTLVIQDEESA